MNGLGGLSALRRFSRPVVDAPEACEGCGAPLPDTHDHRLHVGGTSADRRLECVCVACAAAGAQGGPWKRVPRRCFHVHDLDAADVEWEGLGVPIRLAFFVVTSDGATPLAYFPSPAGAIELQPDRAAWARMNAKSAAIQSMRPDVEALLVDHTRVPGQEGALVDQYVVSIDICYRLVGIVRAHWRGLSGGTEVWRRVDELYVELRREASDA